ncbi:YjjG family noncanonical pyrimidine nucleotidase [Saccharibacillus sp. JS10]|uniref:YjjG family noncanonical pyrimidine nucleotidase n=1 Tax=Saccharibacillus sp. JS10 TaxID=2950552 RepID=UPI00210C44A4|nr:YjjG family noncanonical pyrimidine nucleotidase [Saccharibacillus sp. JS10]MCQ4087123.1 YjjG family noncanonical pyrimidine nucleotidase [Saccharibacillus sp. JS10]
MKTYRYILFDADDTLLDFQRSEREAFAAALLESQLGLDFEQSYEQYTIINRALWLDYEQNKVTQTQLRSERFYRLFQQLKMDHDAKVFGDLYLRHFAAGSFLTPDALAVCDQLKSKFQLSIITNGIRDVQFSRILGSALHNHFDHIIVSDDVGFAKPAPQIFDYAMEKIGCTDKSEVLIVGDSLSSDIRGGHQYGIDTCWYNPNEFTNTSDIKPTYEISKLTQLVKLLSERTR